MTSTSKTPNNSDRKCLAKKLNVSAKHFSDFLDLIEAPKTNLTDLPTIAKQLIDILPLLHKIAPNNYEGGKVNIWVAICEKVVQYHLDHPTDYQNNAKRSTPLSNLKTDYPLYCSLYTSPPTVNAIYAEKSAEIIETFRHLQAQFLNATVAYRTRRENQIKPGGYQSTRYTFSKLMRLNITGAHCIYIYQHLAPEPLDTDIFHRNIYKKKKDPELNKMLRTILNSLDLVLERALGLSEEGTRSISNSKPNTNWTKEEVPAKPDPDDDSPQPEPIRILKSGIGKGDDKRKYDIVQVTRSVKVTKGESPAFLHFLAKIKARYIACGNQLLPSRWNNLNYYEIFHLLTDGIASLAAGTSEHTDISKIEQQELAALITIILFLSKPYQHSLNAIVKTQHIQSVHQIKNNAIHIYSRSEKWGLPVLRPNKAKQVEDQNRPFLRPSKKIIPLSIHPIVWKLLEPWLLERKKQVGSKKRVYSLFEINHQKEDLLKKKLTDIFKRINNQYNTRITLHRVSSYFKQTLGDYCGDNAEASLLLSDLPVSGQKNPLYYFNTNLSILEDQYSQVCEFITSPLRPSKYDKLPSNPALNKSNNSHYIGSAVCPTDECITTLVNNLQDRVHFEKNNSNEVSSYIAFHNALTSYSMMMLAFASGYRAVTNPLVSLTEVDLEQGFLVISDKDNKDNFNSRLVWLPKICREQIAAFNNYRRSLSEKLYLLNMDLAKKLDDEYNCDFIWPKEKKAREDPSKLPFFFYLQLQKNHATLRPFVKQIVVTSGRDISWEYTIPDNANRHYLRSKLREARVSGEIIDAYMGHWLRGQEPFGCFSTLSPKMLAQELEIPLTQILKENGWKVINGN